MRLEKPTGLERDKLKEEYDELVKQIEYFKQVLSDEILQMKIIKDELLEIKEKYNDPRRTDIYIPQKSLILKISMLMRRL